MKDIVEGQKYNHITVLKKAHKDKKKGQIYLCRCDCGKEYYLVGSRIGKNMSCGCLQRSVNGDYIMKHGESHTRLYKVWAKMKNRCYNENNDRYADYGGRGIKVCPEWLDFTRFREWAITNGYDANAEYMKCTLDRENVDGDYEPDNCRWVNMKVQGNNRRNNLRITYNGENHTLTEWSEILGIRKATLQTRLARGWSLNEAFSKTVDHKRIHENNYKTLETEEKECLGKAQN